MKIIVDRYKSTGDATLSHVRVTDGVIVHFGCYGLEDEKRAVKVYGETRIPAGAYKIRARTHGGFHESYKKRFAHISHDFMLEVADVDGFSDILIHCGNTDDDTAGCLLVGETRDEKAMTIGNSSIAYQRFYSAVREAARAGDLTIEFQDNDGRAAA